MSDAYYGVYLIPPPPLVAAISLAHHIFTSEFNTRIAPRFMAHCTLKGFTKLAPETSLDVVVAALDDLFAHTPAFPTQINTLWTASSGPGAGSAILLLEKTPPFQQLHNEVWNMIALHVASDCLFTPAEVAISGPDFPPHLTLVQSDLPLEPGLFAQGVALAQFIYDSLQVRQFMAQDMQLIEFHSDDWKGEWWNGLRYKQLKGWRLKSSDE